MTIVMNGMRHLSEIVTIDGPVPTVDNQLEKGQSPLRMKPPDSEERAVLLQSEGVYQIGDV